MKIIKLDLSKYTARQQLEKIREEFNEVEDAFYNESESRVVEELWDLIQACLGLLFMYCSSRMLFAATYALHTLKMKDRHKECRITIEEEMDI